ncbi:uncharacterized protein LOC116253104 isoform X1 [Nymphaea colorata]|uniref:uncharacterized protein LOC116253104 isoform X1 n=1 Tax=Nymphaea colorata TaxID=210225 RepID=UPI00129D7C96|nr:uncharacterized protein LOC116253104 isoform X1 [Nymphaea colorata]
MEQDGDEEIEAMKAVYGSDCSVIQEIPPHIRLHIKPRTADDISQQFVEAVLEIRANAEYPMEPPTVDIVDSKGLDGNRQEDLVKNVKLKAKELTSYPMLVALCEEAIETLSGMNHPDGNCPLCLYTLHQGGDESPFLPFMKLMSCFHCFHSECIIRWWKWLQHERQTADSDDGSGMADQTSGSNNRLLANCPVCRKDFHAKDIEHVLDMLKPGSSELIDEEADVIDKEILSSEFENLRRKKYEAALERQRENGGFIEPKKVETLLPGMFLPHLIASPSLAAKADVLEDQPSDNGSENVSRETATSNSENVSRETASSNVPNNAGTSEHRNMGTRKNRAYNQRKHWNSQPSRKQWIKKDTA